MTIDHWWAVVIHAGGESHAWLIQADGRVEAGKLALANHIEADAWCDEISHMGITL